LIELSSQGLSVSAGSEKKKTFIENHTVLKFPKYLLTTVCKSF